MYNLVFLKCMLRAIIWQYATVNTNSNMNRLGLSRPAAATAGAPPPPVRSLFDACAVEHAEP